MLRDEYISPADGRTWREVYQEVENDEPELEVGLHDIHRHIMLDKLGRSRCDACHFGPREERFRVYLFLSNGSEGLEPISCLGCHGRPGEGAAGLRQHHSNSGVSECKTCHPDADPSSYIPLGEDVLPSYYAAPNDVFVNKPTDPCSQAGDEDYAGGPKALDNDGDGRYDMADLDCHPTGPGNNNGK